MQVTACAAPKAARVSTARGPWAKLAPAFAVEVRCMRRCHRALLPMFGVLLAGALGCGDIQTQAPGDPAEVPDEDAAAEPPADAAPDRADADEQPADADVPDDGLLAAYEFDEPSDEAFADESGNGHAAVCVQGCPALADDRDGTGSAARFGEGSFLQIDGDVAFVTIEGLTVAAWVNLQTQPALERSCAVCKPLGTGVLDSWTIQIEGTRLPAFYSATGIEEDFLVGKESVAINVWTHLAITWDGASKKLWMNGRVVGESEAAFELDQGPVIIGGDFDIGEFRFPFDGLIDEVRIYDRPLAPEEIAQLADTAPDP
jgi:Concanavalin A-like lectin/glucanases superfamily